MPSRYFAKAVTITLAFIVLTANIDASEAEERLDRVSPRAHQSSVLSRSVYSENSYQLRSVALAVTYSTGGPGLFNIAGLYTHPFNNLAAATFVAPIPLNQSNWITAIDADPSGAVFYGSAGIDDVIVPRPVTISRTMGALTTIGSLPGIGDFTRVVGMAIDPITSQIVINVLAETSRTRLYSVNASTGATTLIRIVSGLNNPDLLTGDIAIDCTGRMYGIEADTDQLIVIDRSNASAVAVGPLGFNVAGGSISGIDFDNSGGKLYGNVEDFGLPGGPVRELYSLIDLTTGRIVGVDTLRLFGGGAVSVMHCGGGVTVISPCRSPS